MEKAATAPADSGSLLKVGGKGTVHNVNTAVTKKPLMCGFGTSAVKISSPVADVASRASSGEAQNASRGGYFQQGDYLPHHPMQTNLVVFCFLLARLKTFCCCVPRSALLRLSPHTVEIDTLYLCRFDTCTCTCEPPAAGISKDSKIQPFTRRTNMCISRVTVTTRIEGGQHYSCTPMYVSLFYSPVE